MSESKSSKEHEAPDDRTEQVNTRMKARQRAFLKAFAMTANVSGAARAAKVGRTQVYAWSEHDEQFAFAMNVAREEAYDRLEAEAWRRAVDSVTRERPIYSRGELVGTEVITEYSDRMLELMLKAGRPDKFRERFDVRQTVEHQAVGYDAADLELLLGGD